MNKLFFFIFCLPLLVFGQTYVQPFVKTPIPVKKPYNKEVVQITGVVVSSDSLKPVPFTSIIIKNSNKGTISDFYGYFAIVAETGDTLNFSSISYKNGRFVIPPNLENGKYSLIQKLNFDTLMLQEVLIHPWPTREQFREAFMKLNLPDTDTERAEKNLKRAALKEYMEKSEIGDSKLAYSNHMQQYNSQLYYNGQTPPIQLLNPLAWAQFIEAWKRGDFKKKEAFENK